MPITAKTVLSALTVAVMLSACATSTPESRAARVAEARADAATVITTAITPALRSCVPYARGGAQDRNALLAAGFSARTTPLGTPVLERGTVISGVRAGSSQCFVNWNSAQRTAPVGTALTNVMADAGFAPAGNDGNRRVFSNGSETIFVRQIFGQTAALQQMSFSFFRQ